MMKNLVFLLLATTLLFTACKKEDLTDYTNTMDITAHQWKFNSLFVDGWEGNMDWEENRYILDFQTDTTLSMLLSVNSSFGSFRIPEKGEINISKYGIITEVCCDLTIDTILVKNFINVNSYKVLGNNLFLNGPNNLEIKFKQE